MTISVWDEKDMELLGASVNPQLDKRLPFIDSPAGAPGGGFGSFLFTTLSSFKLRRLKVPLTNFFISSNNNYVSLSSDEDEAPS